MKSLILLSTILKIYYLLHFFFTINIAAFLKVVQSAFFWKITMSKSLPTKKILHALLPRSILNTCSVRARFIFVTRCKHSFFFLLFIQLQRTELVFITKSSPVYLFDVLCYKQYKVIKTCL